ncbi:MAG: CPBP family intramembrane metalloprotease [Anaerolineae bacterium]|nr:CPBP family intramembrane metalloprotease [Anaerolineae bacterium]
MAIEDVLIVIVGTLIICGIVAAANYAERERSGGLRNLVTGTLLVLGVALILLMGAQVFAAYNVSDADTSDIPEKSAAWSGFAIAVVTMGLVMAIALRSVREMLARWFPRHADTPDADNYAYHQMDDQLTPETEQSTGAEDKPLFPQMLNYYTTDSAILPRPTNAPVLPSMPEWNQKVKRGNTSSTGYNPYSIVHTVALMLSLYFLSSQFIGFVLSGGLEGIAEDYAAGISAWDILLNGLPQVIIPIIGVGFGVRRNLVQTLKRLGLEVPTIEQLAVGFGVVILLFIFIVSVAIVWQGVVSDETFEEQNQASDALSDSIGTLWMAFLISMTAGVSEEIAFRGALQPVFGLWPTAILFALFHMQYTLTPATLIILGVALAFGWLRRKYNTTVAILAHFLYNFVQLALAVSIPEDAASWIIRLF